MRWLMNCTVVKTSAKMCAVLPNGSGYMRPAVCIWCLPSTGTSAAACTGPLAGLHCHIWALSGDRPYSGEEEVWVTSPCRTAICAKLVCGICLHATFGRTGAAWTLPVRLARIPIGAVGRDSCAMASGFSVRRLDIGGGHTAYGLREPSARQDDTYRLEGPCIFGSPSRRGDCPCGMPAMRFRLAGEELSVVMGCLQTAKTAA